MKKILLKSGQEEKEILIEAFIIDLARKSNIEYLAEIINQNKKVFDSGSYETYLVNIVLKFNIDDIRGELNYDVFLRKIGGINFFIDDENPSYSVQYEKIVLRKFDSPQNAFIEQLMMLIESDSISSVAKESDFSELNAENLLLNFDSYREFEYGVFYDQYQNRGTERNTHFSRTYSKNDYQIQRLELLPIPYQRKFFIDLSRDKYLSTNNLQSRLHVIKNGDLLNSGNFESMNYLYLNDAEVKPLIYDLLRKKNMTEKRKNDDYDIRRSVDWSLYNDDLDSDHQNPDFWNQF